MVTPDNTAISIHVQASSWPTETLEVGSLHSVWQYPLLSSFFLEHTNSLRMYVICLKDIDLRETLMYLHTDQGDRHMVHALKKITEWMNQWRIKKFLKNHLRQAQNISPSISQRGSFVYCQLHRSMKCISKEIPLIVLWWGSHATVRVWRPKNGPLCEVRSLLPPLCGFQPTHIQVCKASLLSGPSNGLLTLNTQLVLEGLFTPVFNFH